MRQPLNILIFVIAFLWIRDAHATIDTICIGDFNSRFYITSSPATSESVWALEGTNASIMPTSQVGDTFFIDWIQAQNGFYNLVVREYNLYNIGYSTILKCPGTEFIDSVYLQGPNDVEIEASPEICFGQTYIFNSNNLYSSYLWSQGSVTDKAEIAEQGIVWLEVTDSYGCSWRDSSYLTVHELPQFDLGPAISVCDGEVVSFDLTGIGVSYEWKYNDEVFSSNAYVDITEETILTNLIKEVSAEVTDNFGCKYSDTVILATCKFFLGEIPTVITPNGDGQNDQWIIRKVQNYPYMFPEMLIEIYDRWGELVWKSIPGYVGNEFKGVDFRGRVLPVDSYFYVIRLNNGGEPITGHITIVR